MKALGTIHIKGGMLFTPTRTLSIASSRVLAHAHWYCGTKKVHRMNRDKRFHPCTVANSVARNKWSRRQNFKTNRWNYRAPYRDMP